MAPGVGSPPAATASPDDGDTANSSESPDPLDDRAAKIREVTPLMFYLRNENGDLVYVPDFSFERWERLVRIARNLSDPERPGFVIEEMRAEGIARDKWVDLDITFTIRRRESVESADDDSWICVPLRLNSAVLRETPQFQSSGKHFLTFDDEQDGYQCWIQAAPDTTHTIQLPLSVPLDTTAGENLFRLQAPLPLASHLSFRVPEKTAEGTIENLVDNTSRPLTFDTQPAGGGEFSTRGVRGKVLLRWHKTRDSSNTATTRLDVFGSITVTANELSQEIRSEGRFVVRGFGGPIESFRVRLPPGMRFRESAEPGYQVEPIAEDAPQADKGQLVEVQLERPTVHEAHVQLIAELPSERDDESWPLTTAKVVDRPIQLQPTRFEFVGAVRHRGRIDFVVKGDWALQWDEDPNVPRVELGGLSPLDREIVSRFRYFSQPSDLRVSIRQKATRISVEPTHSLFVDAQRVHLRTSLTCRTSGSQAGPLALRLRGWLVETLNFADIPISTPVDLTENDPLIVPIPTEAQSTGRFTIQLEARRDLTAGVVSGTDPLRILLPQVEAANPSRTNLIVSPATITVTSAQNVALTPRSREMQALAPLVAPAGALEGPPQPNIFRYRDRGAVESASFVCDFKVQPRSVSVSVTSEAQLDARRLHVEQWFSYTILHEGVDQLLLSVPATLVEGNRCEFRILLDDQPLKLSVAERGGRSRFPVTVQLPQKILGNVELRLVHSPLPMPELATDQPTRTTIPLVFPDTEITASTTIIGNKLTMIVDRSLQVSLEDGPWVTDQGNSEPGRMVATSASDGADARLSVNRRATRQIESTLVLQTWIQTWIAGDRRRDRAVFHIRTSQQEQSIQLPATAVADESQILLAVDHQEISSKQLSDTGKLTFRIPRHTPDGPRGHVVEVWYGTASPVPSGGHMLMHAAQMRAADRAECCYWQLILPSNQLLVRGDPEMTLARRWRWEQLVWWRQPQFRQEDLESWIGASRQPPIPSTTNQYLFTSFGSPKQINVRVASRGTVFFSASGSALLLGLMLVYVPLLRKPLTLVFAGSLLLVAAVLYPDATFILGQAASFGIVLSLVALLLRRTLWRGGATEPMRNRTHISDSKVGELGHLPGDGSSRRTTIAHPMSSHVSSVGSKS